MLSDHTVKRKITVYYAICGYVTYIYTSAKAHATQNAFDACLTHTYGQLGMNASGDSLDLALTQSSVSTRVIGFVAETDAEHRSDTVCLRVTLTSGQTTNG